MTIEEAKNLIISARSIEREERRVREEIESRRAELTGIKSAFGTVVRVKSSLGESVPERVYERLEVLYDQLGDVLGRLHTKRKEIEDAISALEPIEQEIVRAWIDGKTEEQIGKKVGYTGRTVRNYKKRILINLSDIKSFPPIS